jgi:predicted Mrr-cat superfamily restriction endonuclease
MKCTIAILFSAINLFQPLLAHADIDRSCLQSFKVKNSSIIIGGETVKCVDVEKYREQLYVRIDAMAKQQNQQLTLAKQSLVEMESALKVLEAANGGKPGADYVSHFLATAGLIACAKYSKSCIAAVIGKVLGDYTMIASNVDQSARAAAISRIRQLINNARQQLDAGGANPFDKVLPAVIADFNTLCGEVHAACVQDN